MKGKEINTIQFSGWWQTCRRRPHDGLAPAHDELGAPPAVLNHSVLVHCVLILCAVVGRVVRRLFGVLALWAVLFLFLGGRLLARRGRADSLGPRLCLLFWRSDFLLHHRASCPRGQGTGAAV